MILSVNLLCGFEILVIFYAHLEIKNHAKKSVILALYDILQSF